jgi:hypothetical protein
MTEISVAPTVSVFYGSDHQVDELCEFWRNCGSRAYLHYRTSSTSPRRREADGWVLDYEASWCKEHIADDDPWPPSWDSLGRNPDEYVTGIAELLAVDEAVRDAQQWLIRFGYQEPRD